MTKHEKDMRALEVLAKRIAESHTDITAIFSDWIIVTFACASLGEAAREWYLLICQQYPGYSEEECNQKFDYCMRTSKQLVNLGTLMKLASDHGIDISMPVGRPRRKDGEEEKENLMVRMKEALSRYGEYRFNTFKNRAEMLKDGEWKPIEERDLSTFVCRLYEEDIKVSDKLVLALLNNRDFVLDYDPFTSYLYNLKPWNPDSDPDYIRQMFVDHIIFADPENIDFYDMVFRKWFVGMVMLWLGRADENPIMPVFCGEQHVGKTYFIRRILPPELHQYQTNVNPSKHVDKDFIISISEYALMFIDEFSFGNDMRSDAYKYVVTMSESNERDAWGHFREVRKRKASLIAATNHQRFIHDPEGSRRYPGINVVGTKNLHDYPLPYEGAYAQALYLMEHGFNHKPTREESILITSMNEEHMELNDCVEVLRRYFHHPEPGQQCIALTAGDILQQLVVYGFRGKEYNAVAIGRAMKHLGFECRRTKTGNKFLVHKVEHEEIERLAKLEAIDLAKELENVPADTNPDNDMPF